MNELDKIRDEIALELFGMTPAEAHAKKICVRCKQPALLHIDTAAGFMEYQQSALCENCFDEMWEEKAS